MIAGNKKSRRKEDMLKGIKVIEMATYIAARMPQGLGVSDGLRGGFR